VLDRDSIESPVHGQQEGSAYNGHFESVCCHPLFLFNRPGELFPRVGFIVTNLSLPSRSVARFYNQRGTAEQRIQQGKQAAHWTRLSCHWFRANEVRLLSGANLAKKRVGAEGCPRDLPGTGQFPVGSTPGSSTYRCFGGAGTIHHEKICSHRAGLVYIAAIRGAKMRIPDRIFRG